MKITIPGPELNRMMKTVSKCVAKNNVLYNNVEVIHEDKKIILRATNGQQFCEMNCDAPGGDGEQFAMDADMLGRIAANAGNKDIEFSVSGNTCTVRGNGRVRTQTVKSDLRKPDGVKGKTVVFSGEAFKNAWRKVKDTVSVIESKPVLTGVLMEAHNAFCSATFTAMDGVQIAVWKEKCASADDVRIVIPAAVMNLVCGGIAGDEKVTIETDGKRMRFYTDSMEITGAALNGEYPDISRIVPNTCGTELRVNRNELINALDGCGIVNNADKHPVTLDIGDIGVQVRMNSEESAFETEVECDMHGSPLVISFNRRYLLNAMNIADTDEIVMKFTTSVSPVVIQENTESMRLVAAVRTM